MSDLRKAAQDVVDYFDTANQELNLAKLLSALRAALATCPDCGKPTPEGTIHTCSPQKPDPMQQIHAFGREQEALEDARDAALYRWIMSADDHEVDYLALLPTDEWTPFIDAAMKGQA